ncbi:MAG: hypothetical protein Q7U68_01125 [Candidatus Roizmanbacteria bacterium]|nr:hypothetical protein [Candidatus Roizmanbacteria bacterium]
MKPLAPFGKSLIVSEMKASNVLIVLQVFIIDKGAFDSALGQVFIADSVFFFNAVKCDLSLVVKKGVEK